MKKYTKFQKILFTVLPFIAIPIIFLLAKFVANHKDVNPNLAIKLLETYEKSGKKPAKVVKFAIDEYTAFMNALADTNSKETDEELEIIEA